MNWFEWVEKETCVSAVSGKPEALSDLLVIDVSYCNMAGCVCSSFLAECGARVIRIEPPDGDPVRSFSPEGILEGETGLGYVVEGRNKEHVTLDIFTDRGREIFLELASKADVLIETHLPGMMDENRTGFRDLSSVNDRLVYLSITPDGTFGPRAGSWTLEGDVVGQAKSGVVYLTGEPPSMEEAKEFEAPTKVGSWFAWYAGGIFGAFSVMGALLFRDLTGKGQMIDLTPSESIMQFLDYNLTWYHAAGRVRERLGNFDIAVFPYTFVKCRDGYAFIAAYNDDAFKTLCEIMGKEDLLEDPRFSSFKERTKLENERVLFEHIEEWSSNYTADEILVMVQDAISKKTGPAAAVVTGRVNRPDETLSEDHWWKRGVFERVNDPNYGEIVVQGPGFKMTETPPRLKWHCRGIGEDTDRVFKELLGMDDRTLEELRREGII